MISVTSQLLKLLNEELAPETRAKTYYHGTCCEDKALSILRDGLDPSKTEVKYGAKKPFLRPIDGHVYVTPNPGYAMIYALGGDVAGTDFFSSQYGKNFIEKDGRYGFLFVIRGEDMTDAVPDEDDVGAIVGSLLSGHRYQKFDWALIDTVAYRLKSEAEINFSPSTLRRVKDGDMAWCAKVGKKLLKVLPQNVLQVLIKANSSLAHSGHLKVSECWKIDKTRCAELAKDGSNLKSIGERVSG